MTTSARRVVITGVGILSPIGTGRDAYWKSLSEKRSGIAPIERLPGTALPHNVAGEVKEWFDDATARKGLLKPQRKSVKVMCREIQLGVASANIALGDSNLDLEAIDHERLGVEFGANQMFSPPPVLADSCFVSTTDGQFDFDRWGNEGLQTMDPLWLLKYLPNMPACHIGIHADARGPNNSLTMAEASGNCVLAEALRIIVRGRADMMVAGSTGSRLHPTKCLHAALWDELADFHGDADPSTWCRPFDANRGGQVVSEGACTLILEEEEHAKARGADILGSVLGAGCSCVIDRAGKPSHRQALVNAMRMALRDAGVSASEIGHINAHGLGGRESDVIEAQAIHDVFEASASTVPVTSIKGYIGNSGAASGTLELSASLLGLRNGVIPATLNCTARAEEIDLNVVTGDHLATTNKMLLNINVTSNGQAAAIVACGA